MSEHILHEYEIYSVRTHVTHKNMMSYVQIDLTYENM